MLNSPVDLLISEEQEVDLVLVGGFYHDGFANKIILLNILI